MFLKRDLPIIVFLLAFLLLTLIQHLISTELGEYLEKGKRYYFKRLAVCLCFLLVAFIIYIVEDLTLEVTMLFILTMYSIVPLMDIVHVVRKIPRR